MSSILLIVAEIDSFDLERMTPGERTVGSLAVECGELFDEMIKGFAAFAGLTSSAAAFQQESARYREGTRLLIPILAVRGNSTGRTLLATAGVHGDEYEGMEAIYRIYTALDPSQMTGSFIALPIVAPPAYWLATRINPADGKNLARCFPGSRSGSLSERIADLLVQKVFPFADAYVDLHSAGRNYESLTFCGFTGRGEVGGKSRDLAHCFGAPVIWEHDEISPGRTLSSSLEMGIPSIYAEALGSGRIQLRDAEIYERGLANLLACLGIVELPQAGRCEQSDPMLLAGDGDLDRGVSSASCSGLFVSSLKAGAKVHGGQELGLIRDFDGRVLERPRSPSSGVIVFHRTLPRIQAGEMVSLVARVCE